MIIAALVLLPESVAAVRAALANRLQTSLNLGLGFPLPLGLCFALIGLSALLNIVLRLRYPAMAFRR